MMTALTVVPSAAARTLAAVLAAVAGFFTGRTAHRREVERHQVAMQMRRI